LLFREPNPMPLKHWLWRRGLIASAEGRLPLTRGSGALARELDRAAGELEERAAAETAAAAGGGEHLAREDLEAPRLELGRDAPARVQLGHDPVQPELLAEPGEAIDHAGRGAEGHLAGEDVVVGEAGHALGLELPAVGGAGAGAP